MRQYYKSDTNWSLSGPKEATQVLTLTVSGNLYKPPHLHFLFLLKLQLIISSYQSHIEEEWLSQWKELKKKKERE